ncbi:alpha/beta hydrolase [Herbiconiux sp. P15]|uniref:alpha/beta hydrolase n=1 Tax=Herbiconiux liukaitaii TaxID=3342799 RepID=UPI0035B79221
MTEQSSTEPPTTEPPAGGPSGVEVGPTEFVESARGDRVAFDRYGEGPALVFIAGAGPFRAGDPITTATARLAALEGITTLVFDRLGRGESEAEGVLDLDRELDAIRAAIEAATGDAETPAVLCGHSSGCSLALAAAAAGLPVSGLALWEFPLSADAEGTAEWIAEFERLLDAGDLDGAQRQYMRDMPPEFLEAASSSPAWPAILQSARTLRADGRSLVWASEALASGELAGIRVPVLTMYGTETFPEMKTAAALVTGAMPQAVEKEVAGAMHSWDPTPMAAELAAFTHAAAARP